MPRHLLLSSTSACAQLLVHSTPKNPTSPTPPHPLHPRSVEAKMAMLVEAPAAVEDALASLLDHPEPLVQVGGWAYSGVVQHI